MVLVGFQKKFCERLLRGIKLSHRRLSRRLFVSLLRAKRPTARLSVPVATTSDASTTRRLVVAPARFGWCKPSRVFFALFGEGDERTGHPGEVIDRRGGGRKRPKIVSLFGFLPKTRSLLSVSIISKGFKKKRKPKKNE